MKKTPVAINDSEILDWIGWLTTEACKLADLECEQCLIGVKTCVKLVDRTMDAAVDRNLGYSERARKLVKYLTKVENLTILRIGSKITQDRTTSTDCIDSKDFSLAGKREQLV